MNITDNEGNPYEIQDGDEIKIQVRNTYNRDEGLLFDGIITDVQESSVVWWIQPDQTANADPEIQYYWDAQITVSNGDVFTFIPISKFNILDEVTL